MTLEWFTFRVQARTLLSYTNLQVSVSNCWFPYLDMIYLVYLSSEHGGAVGQKETQQLAVFGTQGKLTVSRQPLGH